MGVRRCPTLPQGPPCSTIGAVSLSFRVRNVSGRFPDAMAAVTRAPSPTARVRGLVGKLFERCSVQFVGSSVGNHTVDASHQALHRAFS